MDCKTDIGWPVKVGSGWQSDARLGVISGTYVKTDGCRASPLAPTEPLIGAAAVESHRSSSVKQGASGLVGQAVPDDGRLQPHLLDHVRSLGRFRQKSGEPGAVSPGL